MLNILIVDDETPARDRLARLVRDLEGFQVVGEACSGVEALAQIKSLQPDILLLDISMPGMDGMTLARVLRDNESPLGVIFCTAYQDQALQAFEHEAIDYLVKPVRAERLQKALGKAKRYLGEEQSQDAVHFLRSTVGGKVVLTPIHRVICLLAEDKYTTVVHETGETVIDESLTELENRFPKLFFRVHRNALVSNKHIRGLERTTSGNTLIILSGTDRKPEVSRRNAAAVRKLLNKYS